MRLDEFLADYASRQMVSDNCLANYRKHLADFQRSSARTRTRDFQPQLVDRWLAGKLRAGCSPYYVHGLRASILAIWNDAYKLGFARHAPAAMRVRRADLLIKTWTPEDVAALVAAARQVTGLFANIAIPRGVYLATAIAATWYAGIRRGDLHRVRYDQMRIDGTFELLQNKSGRRHLARIPPKYLHEISQWTRPPGPIWPRPGTHELIRRAFRQLVNTVRRQRPGMVDGDWRDIRRSAENTAERRFPGRGHLLAGHERRTFEKYYRESDALPPVSPDPLLY